jgi:hypothetical protein
MRLYDAYKTGEINRTEYLAYLNFGYKPSDTVFLTANRNIEMMTISYLSMGSNYNWSINDSETAMGYVGPVRDMTNAGKLNNAGSILFLYNTGKVINTGTITNTGNITLKSI